jgi:EAL domain-containing protein (putative c-di-GMP-specific phosphodiesterase class I)
VTVSVGLVRIDRNTTNPGDLLNDAFSACRAAKEAGKNCSRLHQPSSLEYSQRKRMIRSVPVIEQAMEKNLIELFAQPITPLLTEEDGEHHEILLRVQDEDGDLKSPVEFIKAAEQFDLMRSIDRRVVNAFFRWLEKHKYKAKTMGGFTLNLSGQSLLDDRFAEFLKEQISYSPVSPQYIGFEVTETALVKSTSQANSFIQGIREMGCYFYLDDFGSGYASYSHLKDMPVDVIKIDGVFVSDMLEQKSSYTMVKSVTEIAHFMGKKVIAEFVENEEILHALRKLKVDFAQGYAVGHPVPLDKILRDKTALN